MFTIIISHKRIFQFLIAHFFSEKFPDENNYDESSDQDDEYYDYDYDYDDDYNDENYDDDEDYYGDDYY